MFEVKADVAEIKTDIKHILVNCKRNELIAEDIDNRLIRLEKWQDQVVGAWKLMLVGVSMGIVGFVYAIIDWIRGW